MLHRSQMPQNSILRLAFLIQVSLFCQLEPKYKNNAVILNLSREQNQNLLFVEATYIFSVAFTDHEYENNKPATEENDLLTVFFCLKFSASNSKTQVRSPPSNTASSAFSIVR